MVDRGLERRREHDPEREAADRPDERGDCPDDGAVRQQHEPDVLLRRADRSEHAELPEPSLRDDREPRSRDQRGAEQEDRGHGEDRQRLHRAAGVASPVRDPHQGGVAAHGVEEGGDRCLARAHEDVDVVGAGIRGGDERELVSELPRVLDDADDCASGPVERELRARLEPQKLGDAVGHGDLARAGRVAAAPEREQLAAVGALGVLRPVLDRLDTAGDGYRAAPDRVDRPERLACCVEPRAELRPIRGVEREQLVGRAELAVVGRNRVGRDRDAADRGGDGDREERQHEELPAPLAAEHPRRPPHDRAARSDAAVVARAQRRSPAASSDSAPGRGDVWSTTRPSRRKTRGPRARAPRVP
jgi:hypothetical protein